MNSYLLVVPSTVGILIVVFFSSASLATYISFFQPTLLQLFKMRFTAFVCLSMFALSQAASSEDSNGLIGGDGVVASVSDTLTEMVNISLVPIRNCSNNVCVIAWRGCRKNCTGPSQREAEARQLVSHASRCRVPIIPYYWSSSSIADASLQRERERGRERKAEWRVMYFQHQSSIHLFPALRHVRTILYHHSFKSLITLALWQGHLYTN